MKLISFTLENFRGYSNETINLDDFSTIVGKNDAGKSTILEAMEIFFDEKSKIDKYDFNIHQNDKPVTLTGVFTDLPDFIELETIATTFKSEHLLDKNGNLILSVRFSAPNSKRKEFLQANMPKDPIFDNIHSLKIKDLKDKFKDIIEKSVIDKRKSSEIRKVAFDSYNGEYLLKEIDINSPKEDMKSIVKAIHSTMPIFQLFKSDRVNSDKDSEVQDPVKAIINGALRDSQISNTLEKVKEEVNQSIEKGIENTKQKMREIDPELSKSISIKFDTLKWDKVFNFNVFTEGDVPLEKRGSGFRRLMLLSFFRAEAEKEITTNGRDIIYAFEEPETSQHPNNQIQLIKSFILLSERKGTQIIITTHSPSIVSIVPKNYISLVTRTDGQGSIGKWEDNIQEIINELGIVPNLKLYPDQIKEIIFVEGNSDVKFYESLYQMINNVECGEKGIVFIPCGGSQIREMVNENFVKKLNVKRKVALVDGDAQGNTYKNKFKSEGIETIQLKKTTLEAYFSNEYLSKILQGQNIFTYSKEQWSSGHYKLIKGQKRELERKTDYIVTDRCQLEKNGIKELEDIIEQINSIN